MIDPHVGDQSIGESAAVPMNVLTKKQSARVEGLKEGIGSVPTDGSDDRWRSIEEGIGCMPMETI